MLEKTITICGKDVKFRSSATIPRLYRIKFKRDIFKDLSQLEKSYKAKASEDSIPGTIDEWLDQFEMFSIYEILPEILELWGSNLQAQVDSKKNFSAVTGK